MPDLDDVRRLALGLPEASAETGADGGLSLKVAGKGFAWTYLAREAPKRPRVPHPDVLAIRCELPRKELLIEAAPQTFFDDDHYRGFPAVLARLPALGEAELAALLEAAWRIQAPKRLAVARAPR
jgi:hypothetical protein